MITWSAQWHSLVTNQQQIQFSKAIEWEKLRTSSGLLNINKHQSRCIDQWQQKHSGLYLTCASASALCCPIDLQMALDLAQRLWTICAAVHCCWLTGVQWTLRFQCVLESQTLHIDWCVFLMICLLSYKYWGDKYPYFIYSVTWKFE